MNPELPQVHSTHEAAPQIPGSTEYFPDGTVRSPELNPARSEQRPATVESAPALPSAPVIAPPPAAMPQQDQTTLVAAGGAPAFAADDDLIEKEWVDKAKKIIAITRSNPYEQAKAIAQLQADYLKKRHNRELGGADD